MLKIVSKRYVISSPWLKEIGEFSPSECSKLTLKGTGFHHHGWKKIQIQSINALNWGGGNWNSEPQWIFVNTRCSNSRPWIGGLEWILINTMGPQTLNVPTVNFYWSERAPNFILWASSEFFMLLWAQTSQWILIDSKGLKILNCRPWVKFDWY